MAATMQYAYLGFVIRLLFEEANGGALIFTASMGTGDGEDFKPALPSFNETFPALSGIINAGDAMLDMARSRIDAFLLESTK